MIGSKTHSFTASVTYDLSTYHESRKGDRYFSLRSNLLLILSMVIGIPYGWCLYLLDPAFLSMAIYLFVGVFWSIRLFYYLQTKNGGTYYKRMLASNNGKPVQMEYTFLDDGIHTYQPETNATTVIGYDQILAVWETEYLYTVLLEYKRLLPIHKHSINGGSQEVFLQQLLSNSPKVKKKQLRSPIPGRIIHWVFIAFSACSFLFALWLSFTV